MYLEERGGLTTNVKKIFWAKYGYRAAVINDHKALAALLAGDVDLEEVPGASGSESTIVPAFSVVSSERPQDCLGIINLEGRGGCVGGRRARGN